MVDPSITGHCVLDALSVDYRSLDTAQYYENFVQVNREVDQMCIDITQFAKK